LVISLLKKKLQIKSSDQGVPKILSFPQHTCSGTLPSGYYFAFEIRLHATFWYKIILEVTFVFEPQFDPQITVLAPVSRMKIED
jgi:hypothetical protein